MVSQGARAGPDLRLEVFPSGDPNAALLKECHFHYEEQAGLPVMTTKSCPHGQTPIVIAHDSSDPYVLLAKHICHNALVPIHGGGTRKLFETMKWPRADFDAQIPLGGKMKSDKILLDDLNKDVVLLFTSP